MEGNSDTSKTVSSANGDSQKEVPREAWGSLKSPRKCWKTPTTNRPVHQEYVRRRPGRPRKNLLPWTPEVQIPRKQPGGLTSDLPVPTSYFAVLRPERTYERRPLTCPSLRKELPKRVLEQPGNPNVRSVKEPATPCPKPNTMSSSYMLPPVLDFPGPRVPPKAPPKAPVVADVSATAVLLCSQLDKLQKAAKSGNEEAQLLLEQYKAFGKQRHHFSERMLLKCSLWRARSCYSYHCARRTQLFTLPGRTTLHRYGQLGSSS